MKAKTTAILITIATTLQAQWLQTGGYVNTKTATHINCTGDLTLEGGTLNSKSKIYCQNLDEKPAAALLGSGYFYIRQDLLAKGNLAGTLQFVMTDNAAAKIEAASQPIYRLWLQKDAGQNQVVRLASPLALTSQLRFAKPGSKIQLDSFDLTLLAACKTSGATNKSYVVTNGTGRLVKKNLAQTSFNFPIGASATTYNPLIISNNGTTDDIGARCLPEVLTNGDSGNPLTSDAVAASWQVSEAVAGGSNFNLTAGWYVGDELPNFTRNNCALRRWDGTAWDTAPLGSFINTNPYQRVRNGVAATGIFAVLDASLPFQSADDRSQNQVQMCLSPNPATEFVQVQIAMDDPSQAVDLQLFNLQGELIFQQKNLGGGAFNFDVRHQPSGSYFVQVRVAGEVLSSRFLKI